MPETPGSETSGPETTEDGHHIVVNGRKWRATDPHIPEALRIELVEELMSARRAVGQAKDDEAATKAARARVQDAKVALGERGDPWWEPPGDGLDERLAAAVRTLLRHRAADKTICPSDAARVAGGTAWRTTMDAARAVATRLADAGVVEVRQKGGRGRPTHREGAAAAGPRPALAGLKP